jgi:hypothetical protein
MLLLLVVVGVDKKEQAVVVLEDLELV